MADINIEGDGKLSWTISTLDDEDMAKLWGIYLHGTLDGDPDPMAMIRFLANSLFSVAHGEKQTPKAMQEILDRLGVGKSPPSETP